MARQSTCSDSFIKFVPRLTPTLGVFAGAAKNFSSQDISRVVDHLPAVCLSVCRGLETKRRSVTEYFDF